MEDNYHGTVVADPYRWLENDTSKETGEWVAAQNKVTSAFLRAIPYRDKIRDRIKALLNYTRYSQPYRVGSHYFFSKNDGLQNQSVIYRQKGLQGTPEVFLDPNRLSENGTVSVELAGFSHDDKLVAWNRSAAGSDWSELHVSDVETGRELPDVIRFVKFSGAAFRGSGFYYSRYPEQAKGQELSAQNRYHSVWYHRIGTSQSEDQLVYEDRENPMRYHGVSIGKEERFLVLSVSEGTDGNELRVMDLAKGQTTFRVLIPGFSSNSAVVDEEGDRLLVYTNAGAKNFRLVSIDPASPEPENWKEIIPEKPERLKSVTFAGSRLFAHYLKDVCTRVYVCDRQGRPEREVELPAAGSADGFAGEKTDSEVFYTFSSFNYPPTIFRYDLASGRSQLFSKPELNFDPAAYVVKQVFVPSGDGKVKIPLFIVHKKGLKTDGRRPTLLNGYGGFNVSTEPTFSPGRIAFLEQEGVFALACLRGGGEYGEDWHRAGMFGSKQNVFDDFISCAEWLQKNGYTSPEKLAVTGSSNGGLLIGAVMTQRPELFAVAIPQVGVLDMLRFHKFTIGYAWTDEYGNSDKKEDFGWLYKYSPLHNVGKRAYPATMVMTADHDDRVVPAHSFKFISELQAQHTGKQPVLIRVETQAGHGAGTALGKSIESLADIYSFIFWNTRSPVKP